MVTVCAPPVGDGIGVVGVGVGVGVTVGDPKKNGLVPVAGPNVALDPKRSMADKRSNATQPLTRDAMRTIVA